MAIQHQHSEHLHSWHLGTAAQLAKACTEAMDAVGRDGGDRDTVNIEIADGTDEPNLAQLHKRTLTDGSHDLVIQ